MVTVKVVAVHQVLVEHSVLGTLREHFANFVLFHPPKSP